MAKDPSFVVGTTVKIRYEFRVADVLTAPSTVVLTIEEPDGTDNTPTVTNDATGKKSSVFVPDQTGYHRWRVDSTGANAPGRREGRFYVATSNIT